MSQAAAPEKLYRQRVRRARFGLRLVRSAGRKRRGWLDRFLTRLLRRATTPAPGTDFMRDELVDANIGFDPADLERYQRGEADVCRRASHRWFPSLCCRGSIRAFADDRADT